MNAHANRCGLSLFVIVGVVVIPWTQQESITPFFLWYGYKKGHQMSKKTIIFQEYEKVETREVDELFSFSILFHNKWSLRNTIHQSEFVVVAMCRGLSKIALAKINQTDYLIIDDGVSSPRQLNDFLSMQCDSSMMVTPEMLYHAIYDSTDQLFPKMRLTDIYYNYKWLVK